MRPSFALLAVLALTAIDGAHAQAGTAPAAGEPLVEFTVSPGDTLIGLSNTVFVSAQAWREIAALNKLPDPNRITPGQMLRVPARLMRTTPRAARVLNIVGDVSLVDAAGVQRKLQSGDTLAEGAQLRTSGSGTVVVGLADGSRMKLLPDSVAVLEQSRAYGTRGTAVSAPASDDGWFAGTMRLLSGSLEAVASQFRRAKPLEVQTPTAVIGVRGTSYRVHAAGEKEQAVSRTEVLEGKVRADSAAGAGANRAGADVGSGFGAALDAAGTPPTVRALLAAPDLSAVPQRFERPVVRFASPASDAPVRVQVAEDEAFDRVVSDQRLKAGTEVRVGGLPDGNWWLRARKLDDAGIEGYDAKRSFVLKARPEPPATIAPRAGEKMSVGRVAISWTANTEAHRYHLQIARDPAFTNVVQDLRDVAATNASAELAQPGVVHWRLASLRTLPDGRDDRGPWGDAQAFELKALPEPPRGGIKDGQLELTWGGRPQDKFQVELARDTAFTNIVARAELVAPQWALAVPKGAGTYYFRYRSVEPDGWVSPPSTALSFEVRPFWPAPVRFIFGTQ